jgi:hypothetical protein
LALPQIALDMFTGTGVLRKGRSVSVRVRKGRRSSAASTAALSPLSLSPVADRHEEVWVSEQRAEEDGHGRVPVEHGDVLLPLPGTDVARLALAVLQGAESSGRCRGDSRAQTWCPARAPTDSGIGSGLRVFAMIRNVELDAKP